MLPLSNVLARTFGRKKGLNDKSTTKERDFRLGVPVDRYKTIGGCNDVDGVRERMEGKRQTDT